MQFISSQRLIWFVFGVYKVVHITLLKFPIAYFIWCALFFYLVRFPTLVIHHQAVRKVLLLDFISQQLAELSGTKTKWINICGMIASVRTQFDRCYNKPLGAVREPYILPNAYVQRIRETIYVSMVISNSNAVTKYSFENFTPLVAVQLHTSVWTAFPTPTSWFLRLWAIISIL